MPELPEVETVRRGISEHVLHRAILKVHLHETRLRWPVPTILARDLRRQEIIGVRRRGKYLLLETPRGYLIVHLGMTGTLRIVPANTPPEKHDHVDFVLDNKRILRFRDPRRFGSVLWTREAPENHSLIRNLGPEPLESGFSGDYLFSKSRGRSVPVKSFLMNGTVVAGVGNIYACEALFRSGIHPARAAGRISLVRYGRLAPAVQSTLREAIDQGGTTLRDFLNEDGEPGYFLQKLSVYGREGSPCDTCRRPIRKRLVGQRSSYYCPYCQR